MLFALGIIIGLLLAIIVLVVTLRFQTPLKRSIERTNSALKPKGSILEAENEDFNNWIDKLPKE